MDPSIVKHLNHFDSRALQIFEKAEFVNARTPGSTLNFSENRETVRDAANRICEFS